MKKLFLALTAAVFLFGGSMTAQAYSETVSGVQCYCSITGKRSVMAYTACSNTTVTITSTAYNSADNSIKTEGDARNGYASVSYTTNENIEYAVQVHTVPATGIRITAKQYV